MTQISLLGVGTVQGGLLLAHVTSAPPAKTSGSLYPANSEAATIEAKNVDRGPSVSGLSATLKNAKVDVSIAHMSSLLM